VRLLGSMLELFEMRHDASIALCRAFGIAKLEAVGSFCAGRFDIDRQSVDACRQVIYERKSQEAAAWRAGQNG
jgi:hypothetical protein